MMDWNGNMTAAGWVFSSLVMLLIVGLVVGLVIWAVRAFGDQDRSTGPGRAGESAREILDRRLACGELTAEQYAQLRDALESRDRVATGSEHHGGLGPGSGVS